MQIKWNLEKLREIALKYKTRGEFQKKDYNAYCAAQKRGILRLICSHMKSVRNNWSNEELGLEAKKYTTKQEFQKNNYNAYQIAVKRKILKDICSHMEIPKNTAYSIEELTLEALKYKTRGDFAKNNPSAYNACWRLNILDQLCKHMKKLNSSSNMELELLHIIKNIYPSAIKFRDRKVKIEDKPWVHRFELDILIPELKKAIEFDGKWYHSPTHLAKTKKKWPLEDALNRKQIKDDWFMSSKGIKILHIDEIDWIENKQKCIQECFKFLA